MHYHVALPSRNVIRNLTADSCKAASDGFVGEVWSLQIAFEGVTTKYLKLHSVELSTRLGSQLTFFFFDSEPHHTRPRDGHGPLRYQTLKGDIREDEGPSREE